MSNIEIAILVLIGIFNIYQVLFKSGRDSECDCEACFYGYTGWETEEYAEDYPDCIYNINNKKNE